MAATDAVKSRVAVVEATVEALSKLKSEDPWYVVWDSTSHLVGELEV